MTDAKPRCIVCAGTGEVVLWLGAKVIVPCPDCDKYMRAAKRVR